MTAWLSSGPNELQRSILYSDWGRPATFEFDLPNGEYNVTVSVGWQGRTYLHHKVDIEGVSFVNDEPTTPASPYLVRTQPVTITDHKLTLAMGIFNEYTMLNYLEAEAVNQPVRNLRLAEATPGSGTLNVTLLWTPPPTAASTTIRYATVPISEGNWGSALSLADSLPGSQNSFNGDLVYSGGLLFFALKVQNAQGDWSELSNNAFWPSFDIYLPRVGR